MSKTTTTSEKSSQKDNTSHQSANHAGRDGVAQAPPNYGIDFVDNAPIQRVAAVPAPPTSPQSSKQNRTGLPAALKTGVESLSGFAMDDVRVHYNSSKPAQLQAHAYAQGNQIHLGPGQEKHLPHEAWHVVQQKQGRVQAKRQAKGMWLNDDTTLEQEADRMGAKAIQQKTSSPSYLHTGQSSHVVQRKVGFELEMQVLIDRDGKDPGYSKVWDGDHFAIHVDHANRLASMTNEATKKRKEKKSRRININRFRSQASKKTPYPQEGYTSIIELVTKPIDETSKNGPNEFDTQKKELQEFVTKLNKVTDDLTKRAPLKAILPTAPDNLYVSLDTQGTPIQNDQRTDAYIQATVGLDIAQVPALMKMFESANVPNQIFVEQDKNVSGLIQRSRIYAKKITERLRKTFKIEKTERNQGLANLEGIISIILLYLGTTHYRRIHTILNPKNIIPIFSHTNLENLTYLLTGDEQSLIDNKREILIKIIKYYADKLLNQKIAWDQPMVKRIKVTPKEFIENVLTGEDDGITNNIFSEHTIHLVEDVGNANPRREAPVFEFRNLRNGLDQRFASNLDNRYFPFHAWDIILSGIFNNIRELNLRGAEQE